MIRIFADQCVNTDLIDELRCFGFDVTRAREKNMGKASDEEIFHYALKTKSILLTFDKDFGNIIRFNIKASHGIVIVYIDGMDKNEIILRTTHFFKKVKKILLKGSLFIVESTRVRVWRH